jgi:hypothetical protein
MRNMCLDNGILSTYPDRDQERLYTSMIKSNQLKSEAICPVHDLSSTEIQHHHFFQQQRRVLSVGLDSLLVDPPSACRRQILQRLSITKHLSTLFINNLIIAMSGFYKNLISDGWYNETEAMWPGQRMSLKIAKNAAVRPLFPPPVPPFPPSHFR